MAGNRNYHDQVIVDNQIKLRELQKQLPKFCAEFFRGVEPTTSSRTRIAYCYDLIVFFNYIKSSNPEMTNVPVVDYPIELLDKITATDIEEYLEYLKYYTYDGQVFTNDERGIKRKFASLRSFFLYYQKRDLLRHNPTVVVDMPKLHDREIIRLDADEVSDLLELVEHGRDHLSGMKKVYYEKNKQRNIAIFTLFLGTGIRVSECVGLDIEDVDFKNNRIRIIRKGGKEEYVYFGEEVANALKSYITEERVHVKPREGHEHALFYSIQKRRISVQAIENLVNEYTSQITSFKHITPHKLRSTYGTALYQQTGDIYLVAEVLGHNDVNTTRKHYAAMDDEQKRSAADAVTLHKKR